MADKRKLKKWRGELHDPLEDWYERNLDIENRTVYCGIWHSTETAPSETFSVVDDLLAQNIIKSLYLLDGLENKEITLIWSSYGGDWDSGMAIYDYIKHIKSPTVMKCYGRVRSMGTIILQAANKRLLSPNCAFMIHYGTFALPERHSKDAISEIEEEKRNNATMERIYLKNIKKRNPTYTKKRLVEEMSFDKYLTPKEAVKLGLADGIIR